VKHFHALISTWLRRFSRVVSLIFGITPLYLRNDRCGSNLLLLVFVAKRLFRFTEEGIW
jgi:hypothetical protein